MGASSCKNCNHPRHLITENTGEIYISSHHQSAQMISQSSKKSKLMNTKERIHQKSTRDLRMEPMQSNLTKIKMCIIIQKFWRGYQTRKLFKRLSHQVHQDEFTSDSQLGKQYFTNRDRYQGLVFQQQQKRPRYIFKNGASYEGEWLGDERHGYGVQIWPDGAKYEGYWYHNEASGKGVFTHIDKDKYEGEWAHNQANGYGVYKQTNGNYYEGNWENNMQQGYGVRRSADGSLYEGEFYRGKKQGKGKATYADGSIYTGEWKANMLDGFGEYIWPDKKFYRGLWKQNLKDGAGIFTWPDGRSFDGFYKNDKKHGPGRYLFPNGTVQEGEWCEGRQVVKSSVRSNLLTSSKC